jgi:ribosomal protein L7Ae-like RNA K-turn-binding protein
VPDIEGKLPGRGLWVTASRAIVDQAVRKGAFPRAARRAVKVPADLADQIERLLTRRCINLLGLARRAGKLTNGFVKVSEALQAGRVAALVQAADASEDGRAKLARLARHMARVELLTTAELGLALGRENVVHAALSPGGLTSSFLAEAQRLAGFRSPCAPFSAGELSASDEPLSMD